MAKSRENQMSEIKNFSEVPVFNNEAEEANFWDHHGLGNDLLAELKPFNIENNIEQYILENLRILPLDKQQEVLDFTEFLRQKIV